MAGQYGYQYNPNFIGRGYAYPGKLEVVYKPSDAEIKQVTEMVVKGVYRIYKLVIRPILRRCCIIFTWFLK
jgi:hypothetical protein